MTGHEPFKPDAAATDSDVGPEPIELLERQPGLIGVEFPGMEIEDGCAAGPVPTRACQGRPHEGRRQEPEIPTTADREIRPPHAKGRRWKLQDLMPGTSCQERAAGCVRYPVAIVVHRV